MKTIKQLISFFSIILLLGICLDSLVSCNNDNSITISKDEYNKLIGDTLKPEYPKSFKIHYGFNSGGSSNSTFHIILGSDNHEYIENDLHNGYIFAHSPECKLCKARYDSLMYYLKRK